MTYLKLPCFLRPISPAFARLTLSPPAFAPRAPRSPLQTSGILNARLRQRSRRVNAMRPRSNARSTRATLYAKYAR